MGKKYVRKTTRANWSEEALEEAMEMISTGRMGTNEASRVYGIASRTIRRHLTKADAKVRLGRCPELGFQHEQRLVKHIKELEKVGFAPDAAGVKKMAFEFAEKLGITNRFSREKRSAGDDWFRAFLRRNKDLSIRKSEGLSVARAKGYLSLHQNYLEIESVNSVSPLKYHYFWLRDHCRCPECYNHKTHQISNDILEIPFDIKPIQCEETGDALKLTWADGHKTEYSLNLLKNLADVRQKPLRKIICWDKEKVATLNDAIIPCQDYFQGDSGRIRLLNSILKYGFAIVTEVEPTLEATEKIVRHTTSVQKTVFGEMWEVDNSLDIEDTAYSTIALDAHNDNTYFSEAAGLMVFHMLERIGIGGKTLLVDGFNAVNNLKQEDNELFNILTDYSLESEYIGKDLHFTSTEPVIKLHPITKELMQIRYNTYDRAYLNALPFDNIMDFYKAYVRLGNEIKKESNEWWVQLEPGNVFFIDNWRLLHGRGEYTGRRRLSGCYITRRDWTCTAKRLGLPIY